MVSNNLLTGDASSFEDQVSDWTIINGTHRRLIRVGPYSKDYTGTGADLLGNAMGIISDGGGPTTLTSPTIPVIPDTSYLCKVIVSTNLYRDLRDGFVSMYMLYYDSGGASVADTNNSIHERDITNTSNTATAGAEWYMVSIASKAPPDSVSANLEVKFSSTTINSGTTVGDLWALYDPSITDLNALSAFGDSVFDSLPDFMLEQDQNAEFGNQPLRRYTQALSSFAGDVADCAAEMEFVDPVDDALGIGKKSALTDPVTARSKWLPWLAALTGVNLSSNSANFTSWAAFTAGSIDTWTEWEEDIVVGGSGPDTTWAAIEQYGLGSTDATQAFRDQIATAYNGIHAGRLDTIEAFARTLLNSSNPEDEYLIVKKRHRDNPFLIEIGLDTNVDPQPDGTLMQDVLESGMPVGTDVIVTSNSTPIRDSVKHSYFADDDFVVGMGASAGSVNYGSQFIIDAEGGAGNFVLAESVNNTDPILGGGIGEAPYVEGFAFFSGYRASAETSASAVLDPTGDFDIFVGLSNITTPTNAAGGGTETTSATNPGARYICSGNSWSLHMTETDDLKFVFQGTGGTDIVTSSTTYPFTQESQDHIVWIRVQKNNETIRFYVQKNLYDDWDSNQLGTDQALTGGNNALTSAGASAYVRVLENADPGTNSYAMGLSCVVHRVMLFTAANNTKAWEPSATGVYDFSTAQLDIQFDLDPGSNYDNSFVESSTNALTITVNDSSGTLPNAVQAFVYSGNGDLVYFGKSPDQFNAANPDNLGDTLNAAVADATYDWRIKHINTATDALQNTDGASVTAAGGTGITWDADDYGDLSIQHIEVINTGGSFAGASSGASTVAFFEPTTVPADGGHQEGSQTGTDALGVVWDLNRSFDTAYDYLPTSLIDRSFIHTQSGQIQLNKIEPLEIHSSGSYAFVIRRYHDNDAEIMRHEDTEGHGLLLEWVGQVLRADFHSGQTTWDEWNEVMAKRIGEWNLAVVRYDPNTGVNLNVNGVSSPTRRVALPAASGDYVYTPDSASVSPVSDIELVACIRPDDITPSGAETFLAKWDTSGERAYRFELLSSGGLQFHWSTTGSDFDSDNSDATLQSVGFGSGDTIWVKVQFDVDNDSAGRDVIYWYSSDGVNWTQLGTTQTAAGTTSVNDSTASLTISGTNSGTSNNFNGEVLYAAVYSGFGDNRSLVAEFDPTRDATEGATTVTSSSTGEIWTLAGNTSIVETKLLGLTLPGDSGDIASTPDAAVLDITGDIDIRCHVACDAWSGATYCPIAKYNESGDERGFMIRLLPGSFQIIWSTDGINDSNANATVSDLANLTDGESIHLRVTLDVDDGGDHTATFYTSQDGKTWTQFGAAVTQSGTTSINNSAAALNIGAFRDAGSGSPWLGKVLSAQVYNGIDGTLVANFDPSHDATEGQTTFTASGTGEVWTVSGNAVIESDYRQPSHILGSGNDSLTFGKEGFVDDFGCAWWGVYDRYLTDAECVQLASEFNIS